MKRYFYQLASLTKVSEGGGHSQKDVKSIAKEMGIECLVGSDCSPYVGQFGVMVKTEDNRKLKRFLSRVGF